MAKCVNFAAVLLLASFFGRTYGVCVATQIKNIGVCAYSVKCKGTIRDVDLTFKCDNSSEPETVHLVLEDAIERFDEPLKAAHFLKSVTNLRAVGNWKTTALSILHYTPALQTLYLSGNKIERTIEKPFYKLENLMTLDVSHNRLIDIESMFKFENKRSNMRNLHLSNNEIFNLTRHTFEELESLVVLDLSHNLIHDLSDGPFRNLNELRILKLDFNQIAEVGDALNHLINLEHLHLKGNQIKHIDDGLINVVQRLETIDLSLNDIDSLLSEIFIKNTHSLRSNSVCKVILSNNNIESLPNAAASTTGTHAKSILMDRNASVSIVLDLSNNDIDEIPYDAFEGTNKIISLDLSRNQLYDFIVRPQDLSDVVRLNLSSNYLNRLLSKTFLSMKNLETLDVSHNNLEIIENEAFILNRKLKYVNIANNQIMMFNGLQTRTFHPDGAILDLSHNIVSHIFFGVGEAHRLKALSLKSNNITNIHDVKLYWLMDLRRLDLSNNSIQVLAETHLLLPSGLLFLDLSENKIDTIRPSAFLDLRQLQALRLSHNKLETLSFGIFMGLKNLKSLDLSYNKISVLNSGPFIDLKSLKVLSVRYNRIQRIDENHWIGHNHTLTVYIDGGDLTCEWLNRAIENYRNGWSNMKPTLLNHNISSNNSMENIPCRAEDKRFERLYLQTVLADERLLMTNRKILSEIMHQNGFLKNILEKLTQKEEREYENF